MESNKRNEAEVELINVNLDDESTGVACAKWQPAPMVQDWCSVLDLSVSDLALFALSLFIVPSWQFTMPDMSSELAIDISDTVDIADWDAHEVAQMAASAGLVASARIIIIVIVRKNFIDVRTLPPVISFNKSQRYHHYGYSLYRDHGFILSIFCRLSKRSVFVWVFSLFWVFYCVIIAPWLINN